MTSAMRSGLYCALLHTAPAVVGIYAAAPYNGRREALFMPDPVPVEYAVPRNRAIPSPAFGEVITSEPVVTDRQGRPAGARVRVYEGERTESGLVGHGPLLGFERGWVFLAANGDPTSDEMLREIGEIGARRTAGAALRLAMDVAVSASGLVGKAFRAVTVENFVSEMTVHDPARSQIADLARRAAAGRTFTLPCVDIVRVRSERMWSWTRLRRIDASAITFETVTGETRTVWITGAGAPLAAACMQRRFEQEFLHVAGGAWIELLGLQALWHSLVGRYGDPSSVAVGRVWDDWKNAIRAQMASRQVTPVQVASLALQRMGPWLDHFRDIPPALERVQAAEALAEGAGV
jgi:hypothetical protein